MKLTNTENEYGLIARLFHWAIAFMVLGLLPAGLFMAGMDNSPLKFEIYALHKSFGLLVLFLGVARIVWRFLSPPPDAPDTHAGWERALAGAAHAWLYVCVIGMPLSGWLMSSAAEFPVPFFGANMPPLMGKDEALAGLFNQVHEILAYTLLFVLALHVAGALKHHLLDRDDTLKRMAGRKGGLLVPAAIILLTGAVFTACGLMILKGFQQNAMEAPSAEETALSAAPASDPAGTLAPDSAITGKGWTIVPEESRLEFQATLYNAPFTGRFGGFSGTILFDPDDLPAAAADIRINMDTAVSGDADRDSNMKAAEWFDTQNFPESRFVATRFEKADGNNYVAIGDLTMRGVTMPLIIPFTLDIDRDTAHAAGVVELDRLTFGIGTGQWQDEKTVGHTVRVTLDIKATR